VQPLRLGQHACDCQLDGGGGPRHRAVGPFELLVLGHRPFAFGVFLPLSLSISSCHSFAAAAAVGATVIKPAAFSPRTRKVTVLSGPTTTSSALGSMPPSRAIRSARRPSLRRKELEPRRAIRVISIRSSVHRRDTNVRFLSIFVNMQVGVAQAWRGLGAFRKTAYNFNLLQGVKSAHGRHERFYRSKAPTEISQHFAL